MVGIAELRARNNKMSQSELAEKLNVKQSQISKWEDNPLSISSKNLIKLALYFNISIDELLGVKEGQK